MNYFAHAYPLLADHAVSPYFLAGLAVPDWLPVVSRRTKCRTKHVEPWFDHEDDRRSSLARGIARHHADDQWFHQTRVFTELSLRFSLRIKESLDDQDGMRPSFLGHILVELLLDDVLIRQDPRRLDRYYMMMERVSPPTVADWVAEMSGQDVGQLAEFIPKFTAIRFLADYADDGRLCFRLNQVLGRVKLGQLPDKFLTLLPQFRAEVAARADELLLVPDLVKS